MQHHSSLSDDPFDVNNQLTQIYDWLAVNKLSLNIKKTKYIVFHAINKNIDGLIPELKINDTIIERVENFNFLGLIFNEHMFWKHHINTIANKLIKLSGILNKLKRFLPGYILRTLYFSMVQSRLLYGILAWGFDHQRLVKIQKRFIRIISLSAYNAHTEPWFKHFEILKINNLFYLIWIALNLFIIITKENSPITSWILYMNNDLLSMIMTPDLLTW